MLETENLPQRLDAVLASFYAPYNYKTWLEQLQADLSNLLNEYNDLLATERSVYPQKIVQALELYARSGKTADDIFPFIEALLCLKKKESAASHYLKKINHSAFVNQCLTLKKEGLFSVQVFKIMIDKNSIELAAGLYSLKKAHLAQAKYINLLYISPCPCRLASELKFLNQTDKKNNLLKQPYADKLLALLGLSNEPFKLAIDLTRLRKEGLCAEEVIDFNLAMIEKIYEIQVLTPYNHQLLIAELVSLHQSGLTTGIHGEVTQTLLRTTQYPKIVIQTLLGLHQQRQYTPNVSWPLLCAVAFQRQTPEEIDADYRVLKVLMKYELLSDEMLEALQAKPPLDELLVFLWLVPYNRLNVCQVKQLIEYSSILGRESSLHPLLKDLFHNYKVTQQNLETILSLCKQNKENVAQARAEIKAFIEKESPSIPKREPLYSFYYHPTTAVSLDSSDSSLQM